MGQDLRIENKQDAIRQTEVETYLLKKVLPGSRGEVTTDAPYC